MSQSRLEIGTLRAMVAAGATAAELLAAIEPAVAALDAARQKNRARQRKFKSNKGNVTQRAKVTLPISSSLSSNKIKDLDDNVTQSNVTGEVTLRDINEINELEGNVTGGATSTLTYLLKKERKKEDSKEESKEERKIRGARKNGFRLPDDWNPTDTDFAMAVARLNGSAKLELEKFRDYWKAQPGQRGTKLDWDATFRNWVRNAKPALAPAVQGGSSLMERRIAETRRQLESRRLQAEGKIV
jgi:hypothetical protein